MKAFVYHGDKNFSLENVPMPGAGPGEAVAKIRAASVCGTDLRTFRNGSAKLKTPITIGHEACCEIVEAGEGADLKNGGRYIIAPAIGCGTCKSCRKGRTNMCASLQTIGFQFDGTFAEYIKIPRIAVERGHLIPVPDSVSDVAASVVEPVARAVNAQNYLQIAPDDNVLIYGSGYLGCMHAELAKVQGARRVIIAEISEKRRAQASAFVPDAVVLDSMEGDFLGQVKQAAPEGVDVVITACPAGVTHKQGLEVLGQNGRISLFGGLAGESSGFLDSNLIHYKELCVYGAHASTAAQNREVLGVVAQGKLDVEKYVSTFALAEADKAFDSLIREEATKAVLIP